MGLDMCLTKKTYVGNEYRDKSKWVSVVIPQNQEGIAFPTTPIKTERIREIVESVGYWRKANAIHKWFVENVQEGEDDCREYYVGAEQLKSLLETINTVLDSVTLVDAKVTVGYKVENGGETPILEDGKMIKDPSVAQELLPVESGFFFGGKEYDNYYVDQLTYTKKLITDLLAEDEHGDYYYHSSW
jgi:hypothetical protein